jgi:hypothetical protein
LASKAWAVTTISWQVKLQKQPWWRSQSSGCTIFKKFINSPASHSWAKNLLQFQFSTFIHPPWDSTKLSLSTPTTCQESEQCGKLSFIEDTLITEESLLFKETHATSPTGKKEQEKAKCNP